VLGYVLRNTSTKKKWERITPRKTLPQYICKNTIIPALFDRAQHGCRIAFEGEHSVWRLLKDDPERYMHASMLRGIDKELPEVIARV